LVEELIMRARPSTPLVILCILSLLAAATTSCLTGPISPPPDGTDADSDSDSDGDTDTDTDTDTDADAGPDGGGMDGGQ
jgi:hypothetical protein